VTSGNVSTQQQTTRETAAPQPEATGSEPRSHAAEAALLLSVAGTATATEETPLPLPEPEPPSAPGRGSRRIVRVARSPRRRRPARLVAAGGSRAPSPEPEPQADTQSELRAWMKDNASLLSNTTMLLSIAALALSLLPGTGFVEPYIQALLFGAAFVLLMELHHQWPSDLQLHGLRRPMVSQTHSWRMVGFAFLLQAATAIFAVWAVLTNPLILFPLTALGVVFAFRRWYFRRFGQNWIGVAVGILSLVAAILISELLMVIAWAALTGEQVTLEIWIDERDTFEIRD
jgi:hypothetical protein